jgi:hypothetical protein
MANNRRYPRHRLTNQEGERILWHALEHLQGIVHDLDGEPQAITTIRLLLGLSISCP